MNENEVDLYHHHRIHRQASAMASYMSSRSMTRRGSFARTLAKLEPDFSELGIDGGITAGQRNQWFFEIAWEVANKGEKKT